MAQWLQGSGKNHIKTCRFSILYLITSLAIVPKCRIKVKLEQRYLYTLYNVLSTMPNIALLVYINCRCSFVWLSFHVYIECSCSHLLSWNDTSRRLNAVTRLIKTLAWIILIPIFVNRRATQPTHRTKTPVQWYISYSMPLTRLLHFPCGWVASKEQDRQGN